MHVVHCYRTEQVLEKFGIPVTSDVKETGVYTVPKALTVPEHRFTSPLPGVFCETTWVHVQPTRSLSCLCFILRSQFSVYLDQIRFASKHKHVALKRLGRQSRWEKEGTTSEAVSPTSDGVIGDSP